MSTKSEFWLKDGRVEIDADEGGRTEISVQDTPYSDLVFWDSDNSKDEYLLDFDWSEIQDEQAREAAKSIQGLADLLVFIEKYAPQLVVSDFYAMLFGSHEDFEPAEDYPFDQQEWAAVRSHLKQMAES